CAPHTTPVRSPSPIPSSAFTSLSIIHTLLGLHIPLHHPYALRLRAPSAFTSLSIIRTLLLSVLHHPYAPRPSHPSPSSIRSSALCSIIHTLLCLHIPLHHP